MEMGTWMVLRYQYTRRKCGTSDYISISRLDNSREWRQGCGDDAYNTIRMEKLEECIGSDVCPKNKLEGQGEVYETVIRPGLMHVADTWAVKKAQ